MSATTITIDIETIPCQKPQVIASFLDNAKTNFKAPSTLTKEQAAADLGYTDEKQIKFTLKEKLLAEWVERFREEKASDYADEQWRKTSFDGSLGQVAVVGIALDDQDPVTLFSDDWKNSEASVIKSAFGLIDSAYDPSRDRRPLFIGHYVADFDLRFLFQRAVILGIKPPAVIPFHAKAWSEHIFDTMLAWVGPKGKIGLDALCQALGIPGKDGMDGSIVWDAVRDGKIREVAEYCGNDVRMARAAYQRMTFQTEF